MQSGSNRKPRQNLTQIPEANEGGETVRFAAEEATIVPQSAEKLPLLRVPLLPRSRRP